MSMTDAMMCLSAAKFSFRVSTKTTIILEKAAMKENGDPKIAASTSFSCDRMPIGLFTEYQQEFTSLTAGGHTCVLCADRKQMLPNCDVTAGTLDAHETNSHLNQHSKSTSYPEKTFNLPCSCSNRHSHTEN